MLTLFGYALALALGFGLGVWRHNWLVKEYEKEVSVWAELHGRLAHELAQAKTELSTLRSKL